MNRPPLPAPRYSSPYLPGILVPARQVLLGSTLLFAAGLGLAQGPGTGAIAGRIQDPITGEYARNAEVRVEGTEILVTSGQDGSYRIAPLPPGSARIVATYSGYPPAVGVVEVKSGIVTTHDIQLARGSASSPGAVVALDRFTVSAERMGAARAVMEQRNALTIKNVITSDTFDHMVEGNLGEILQYIPGLEVGVSGAEMANIRLRGLSNRYSSLTIDGVRVSGVVEPGSLNDFSANSADMIEVSKTSSANMDADAPAGTVNMKSKSAFQRDGRFASLHAFMSFDPRYTSLGKTPGPNDGSSRKVLPGFQFDYSDVFLSGTLGVVLNLNRSETFKEQASLIYTYDSTPTAANPAPSVITGLSYQNGPRTNRRQSASLGIEYKLSPFTMLTLRGQVNGEDSQGFTRSIGFTAARNNQEPGSSATRMIARPGLTANAATMGGSTTLRNRSSHTISPSLNYKRDRLILDAVLSYNRTGSYNRNGRPDGDDLTQANYQLRSISWMTQTTPNDTAWSFQQLTGPDLYQLHNWRATTAANNLVRTVAEPTYKRLVGTLDATYDVPARMPLKLAAGYKGGDYTYLNVAGTASWTYLGPTGNAAEAPAPVSQAPLDPRTGGDLFTNGVIQVPDRNALGALLKSTPGHFIQNPADATNNTNVFPNRYANERIDAAYLMATSRLKRLTVQAGVRYEGTRTEADIFERGAQTRRNGEYDDYFLSGSARYRFTSNLMLIGSAGQSIARVALPSMAGVATFNDTTMTGNIPNVNLRPEHGNNYSVRLEYYWEPLGVLAIGGYQFDIKDLQFSRSGVPAEALGLQDEYPGFTFSTQDNAGSFRNRGFEIEYRQQLTFLPGVLRGLGVFANYGNNKVSNPAYALGMARETASAGLQLRQGRLSGSIRGSWRGPTPIRTANLLEWRKPLWNLGVSAGFEFTEKTALFLTGNNILNTPVIYYWTEGRGAGLDGLYTQWQQFSATWTVGVKTRF